MQPPRAILFDLGGTVLRQDTFRPEAWADALPALAVCPRGYSAHAAGEMLRHLIGELLLHGKGGLVEMRVEACLRHLHERLGITLPLPPLEVELAFWRATSRMVPEPGIERVLADLAGRGLPLGLVSNSMFSGEVLRWELERHGLARHFSLVLSSADYGLRKPHPSLFHTAVARLGLPAEAVWFVGDNFANDIAGARGAGLRPLWYRPAGAPAETEPVPRLQHWDELVPLLVPEQAPRSALGSALPREG
jgi:putative hydrolase of the HAD superfamily